MVCSIKRINWDFTDADFTIANDLILCTFQYCRRPVAESIWVMFPPPTTMTAVITYAKSDNVRYSRNSTYFTMV